MNKLIPTSDKVFPAHRSERGFNLLELLVVIGIILLLVALLLPAFRKTTENQRIQKAKSNILMIEMALQKFYNEYGRYPTNEDGSLPDDILNPVQLENLYKILTEGQNIWLDGKAGGNPYKKIYLTINPKDYRRVSSTLISTYNRIYPKDDNGTNFALVDPWENAYMIRFDDDSNSQVEVYGSTTGAGYPPQPLTTTGDLGIWSAGPDKKVDSREDNTKSPSYKENEDNLNNFPYIP